MTNMGWLKLHLDMEMNSNCHLLHSGPRKPPCLQVVSVQSTDIPPKEQVTYAKQTQTTTTGVVDVRDGKCFSLIPSEGSTEDVTFGML